MKKLVLMLAVVFGMTMVSCDNTATNNGEGQDSALNADTTMVEAPAPAPADSMQPADSVKPAEEAKADVKADAAPKAEEPKAEEPKAEEPAK